MKSKTFNIQIPKIFSQKSWPWNNNVLYRNKVYKIIRIFWGKKSKSNNKSQIDKREREKKSVTFFEATEIGFCWSVGIAGVVIVSLFVHRGWHRHHTSGCNARWSRPSRMPRQSHFHRSRGCRCRRWCFATHCTGWTTWKFGPSLN